MAFQEDPPMGVPEWLVTFGDMMSLLLTFFIMLVSMSELKSEQRVALAVEAMKKQFGRDRQQVHGAQRMRGPKVEGPIGDKVTVQNIRPADKSSVGGTIHFEDNEIVLSDVEKARFRPAIVELQGKPQKIEIRGHASKRPLPEGSPYKSHWDLAYARSQAVMDFLIAEGIPAKRLRLAVAGVHEPVQLSKEAVARKGNNRVEVFLLNEFAESFEGTKEQRQERTAAPK
ncbi:MAG: OmpA family protein [Planctomycetaceae bacterium]|nr:OmpA family protein [Planctomycetaceae bacterium]